MRIVGWALIFFLLCFYPSLSFSQTAAALSDEELLETIARKSFDYFVEERNLKTGLVRDRAHNFRKGALTGPASIAATGFALSAYAVGVERGWLSRAMAYEMTRQTLDFFLNQAPHEKGFFYHFLNMETGARVKNSELSPIDTVLFLAGALFSAEYFDDPHLKKLAKQIYERIDFPWMMNKGSTLAMSWSPEHGFSRYRWDHYDESMILYLLGIGSPTHPIPAASWKARTLPVGSYRNYRLIQMPPLFTHQYSHIWIDFRDKNDGFADYFNNSVNATLANRAFAISEMVQFTSYGPDSWGLTASDGPFGYRAYGAPPGWADHDGTLAPTACGGSIVFTPKESIACLRHFYEKLGDKLWGLYGFSDAFNLDKDWFDDQVIGIDQGAMLLMIENYRSELIWQVMSRIPEINDAMTKVGFQAGTKEVPWPDPPVYHALYLSGGIQVDGFLKDWPSKSEMMTLDLSSKEHGQFEASDDLRAEVRFVWDERALYFFAKVKDSDVVVRKSGKNIWLDDLLEIFLDPQGDGLFWHDNGDFQLGFRPREEDDGVEAWSWFQGGENPIEEGRVEAKGIVDSAGYSLEGKIQWDYLGIEPVIGKEVRLSAAVHDIDRDRSEGKLHWFFRNEEEHLRFVLGKVRLKENEKTLT